MARITKLDAATRQLNVAISLLFDNSDVIAVHTLAIASSNIFSDILDKKLPGKSWREKLRIDHGLSHAQVRRVMHEAWNFFKHGLRDPDGVIDFEEDDTLHMIFFATLECGELQPTSVEMQVYQLWYLASGKFHLGEDSEIQRTAEQIFPNLGKLVWSDKLHKGKEMVAIQRAGLCNTF